MIFFLLERFTLLVRKDYFPTKGDPMKTMTTLVITLVAAAAFANAPKAEKTTHETSKTTTTTVTKKDCSKVPAAEKEACLKEQADSNKH